MKEVDGKTLKQWIKQETAKTTKRLWGDGVTFKPVLCSEVLGDGQQMVYLGSISQRPYHWLILIDSNTDIESPDFDVETILRPIEDEFSYEENAPYPCFCWDGGHWGMVVNMKTGQIGD